MTITGGSTARFSYYFPTPATNRKPASVRVPPFSTNPEESVRIRPSNSGQREQGIIITLVAVFMLFVVGAMAALSIDVVTFYTARSEAQIAADSAALAAARVMANSGMTSSTGNSTTNPFRVDTTKTLASAIATQVARQNL